MGIERGEQQERERDGKREEWGETRKRGERGERSNFFYKFFHPSFVKRLLFLLFSDKNKLLNLFF